MSVQEDGSDRAVGVIDLTHLLSDRYVLRERDFRDRIWWTIASIVAAVAVGGLSITVGIMGMLATQRATELQEQAFGRESFSLPPALTFDFFARAGEFEKYREFDAVPYGQRAQDRITVTNRGGTILNASVSVEDVIRVCRMGRPDDNGYSYAIPDTCRSIRLMGRFLTNDPHRIEQWSQQTSISLETSPYYNDLLYDVTLFCSAPSTPDGHTYSCNANHQIRVFYSDATATKILVYWVNQGEVYGPNAQANQPDETLNLWEIREAGGDNQEVARQVVEAYEGLIRPDPPGGTPDGTSTALQIEVKQHLTRRAVIPPMELLLGSELHAMSA